MEIRYNNKNMVRYELPDLLDKFYAVAVLKEFAEPFLYPLFPQLAAMEKPRKADLTGALMTFQKDRKKLEQLIQSLPGSVLSVLEALLWTREANLEELESRLGFEIAKLAPQLSNRYRDCPFQLLPGFELVAIGEANDFYSRYSFDPQKSHYRVLLPAAMRRLLKPGFPKPAYYNWQVKDFEKDLPSELVFFNAESAIASDLAIVGDYLNRGNLKITKAGKIAVGSLRKVMELTQGREFFTSGNNSRKLPEARHILLLQSVLRFEDKLTNLLVKEPFPAKEVFKLLLQNLLLNGNLLVDLFLPHVKPCSFYHETVCTQPELNELMGVFASLPEKGWISAGNLVQYPFYREMNLIFFNYRNHRFRVDPESPGLRRYNFFESAVDLDPDNVFDIVQTPLLHGIAFLLATFGLLEIAYTSPPENPNWRLKGESFLSPFDGLVGLRMTPLGAYAFGKTETLEISLPEKRRTAVHLHPERLMASCKQADPLTIQAMDEFMERLAPELYRLTPEKLLAGCHSKAELRDRIEAFRKRIPAEVPELWEATFRGYLESPDPLSFENAYFIYQIAESTELRQLFISDPVLRTLGLKVEGWRIAATPGDLNRIRERLRSLGYLLESDTPSGSKATGKKSASRKKSRRRYY
jgi:hypothetical protein